MSLSQTHDPEAFRAFPSDIPTQVAHLVDLVHTREIKNLTSVIQKYFPSPEAAQSAVLFLLDSAVSSEAQVTWLRNNPQPADHLFRHPANGITPNDLFRLLPTDIVETPYGRSTYTKVISPISEGQIRSRLKRAVTEGTLVEKKQRYGVRFVTPPTASLYTEAKRLGEDIKDDVFDRIVAYYAETHSLKVSFDDIDRRTRVRDGETTYVYDVTVRVPDEVTE